MSQKEKPNATAVMDLSIFMLSLLAKNPIVTKDPIMESLIARLRRKLAQIAATTRLLQSDAIIIIISM